MYEANRSLASSRIIFLETYMNTTKKGYDFELKVLRSVQNELNSGYLMLVPEQCNVFHRKGYYSKERDTNIVFDISIEVMRPDAETWTFLWLWECKDLSRPVTVPDIEGLYTKIGQVAPRNSKGCVVASGAFTVGAVKYARSNGISLIRLVEERKMKRITEFTGSVNFEEQPLFTPQLDLEEFDRAISEQDFYGRDRSFFAWSDGFIFGNWKSLLSKVLKLNYNYY